MWKIQVSKKLKLNQFYSFFIEVINVYKKFGQKVLTIVWLFAINVKKRLFFISMKTCAKKALRNEFTIVLLTTVKICILLKTGLITLLIF